MNDSETVRRASTHCNGANDSISLHAPKHKQHIKRNFVNDSNDLALRRDIANFRGV
jgi:hypothetical protein